MTEILSLYEIFCIALDAIINSQQFRKIPTFSAAKIALDYFWPIFRFYTPWKYKKQVLTRGIKWKQWSKIALIFLPSACNKSFEGLTETLRTLVDALQTDSRNNNPKFSYSKKYLGAW